MKSETKWVIEVKNDLGKYVPKYKFDSKEKATKFALCDLPKDSGDCRIVEQDGGAE